MSTESPETTSAKQTETEQSLPTRVVGIGASAGGLKSIETFCEQVGEDTDCAFIVVQHLPPDSFSMMPEILARRTRLPVSAAEQGERLLPNHVYICPPGKQICFSGYQIQIADKAQDLHTPIDVMFTSMAMTFGTHATGIVLSGTGRDGTAGLIEIHLHGGVTIAESLDSAQFGGMPQSAISSEEVDHILTPEEMPEYVAESESTASESPTSLIGDLSGVDLLLHLLRERQGMDFSSYNPVTLQRRIQRRAALQSKADVDDYAVSLQKDESALSELREDLLIGTTEFFRDEDAFGQLKILVRKTLEDHPQDKPFRVWVSACASGQEAYSVGIMLLELIEDIRSPIQLKILATDVLPARVEQASMGVFLEREMSGLSEFLRFKYFDRISADQFRVKLRLREIFVFSCQNLLDDAPFTKIDLCTCRNMLIYLQPKAQLRCLARLHFALKPGGLLMIGPSESLGNAENSFRKKNARWRIFETIEKHDALPIEEFNTPLPPESRLIPSAPNFSVEPAWPRLKTYAGVVRAKCQLGMIIDREYNIIEIFGDAAHFIGTPGTAREANFFELFSTMTAKEFLDSLKKSAAHRPQPLVLNGVELAASGEVNYRLTTWAISDSFADVAGWFLDFREQPDLPAEVASGQDLEEWNRHLESELQYTQENLSATIEELATSNEELQASNEEMVASNEELQSMNEELQSVNEELHSVNESHRLKIVEIQGMSDDLATLLNASDIGTVLLDGELKIRRFTAAVNRHFDMLERDVGRPLQNFNNKLEFPDLYQCLHDAVASGRSFATRLIDAFGEAQFVKIVPFSNAESEVSVMLNIIHQSYFNAEEPITLAYGAIGAWEWPSTAIDRMWWSPTCYSLLGLQASEVEATFSN
ncbi:MAG: chemotaxis protein CheB [Planctomycetota bacterium]